MPQGPDEKYLVSQAVSSPDDKYLVAHGREQKQYVSTLKFLTKQVAVTGRNIGHELLGALPFFGGAAGAIVGAPAGPLGAVGGAYVGGTGGEALRQLGSRASGLPSPASGEEAAGQIAGQGVIQAAFEGAGQIAGPVLKRLGEKATPHLGRLAKGVKLSSGELFPATRGTIKPGSSVARLESVVSEMPGGGPLRAARANEQEAGRQIVGRILDTTAAQARVAPQVLPRNIADATEVTGRAFRDTAGPIHEAVGDAMRKASATQPSIEAIVPWAEKELVNARLGEILGRSDVSPSIRDGLAKMASFKFGPIVAGLRSQVEGVSGYDILKITRSDLLELARSGKLSPNERRIVWGTVDRMNQAIEPAIEKTGGKELLDAFHRANSLTRQGYALSDLATELRKTIRGTSEAVQSGIEGARVGPQRIKTDNMVEVLERLARPDSPRSPSTLQRAIPSAVDRDTLRQIAEMLERGRGAGGSGIAAKFGILGIVRSAGAGAGGAVGYVAGGPAGAVGGALAGTVTPEIAAYVFARVLAKPTAGAGLLLKFLKAAPGSAEEMANAARVVSLAFPEEKRRLEPKP